MRCTKCNSEIRDDIRYCPYCGYNFSNDLPDVTVFLDELNAAKHMPETNKRKHAFKYLVVFVLIIAFLFSGFFVFLLGYNDGDIPATVQHVKDSVGLDNNNGFVERGFLNTCITLPKEYLEDIDTVDYNLYENVTAYENVDYIVNPDGSATISMPRKAYKAYLASYVTSVDQSIQEFLDSGDGLLYISSVTHTDNLTVFDLLIDGEDFTIFDLMLISTIYVYSNIYQVFYGLHENQIDITINFKNSNTGESIESFSGDELRTFLEQITDTDDSTDEINPDSTKSNENFVEDAPQERTVWISDTGIFNIKSRYEFYYCNKLKTQS